MASRLYGKAVGEATIVVTVPSDPDTAALRYSVRVVDAG
jgi:hypothetical protein